MYAPQPANGTVIRIAVTGTLEGQWAKYSNGYCQVFTMWTDFFRGSGRGIPVKGGVAGVAWLVRDAWGGSVGATKGPTTIIWKV